MAEQQQQQQPLKAPFPPPPPFYKHFNKQNLAKLRQIQKSTGVSSQVESNGEAKPEVEIFSLPPKLRYLIPPQPPPDGKWTSFAQALSTIEPEASLESSGIEQLYPPGQAAKLNPQPHLLALARSLLTTFLALVGILSRNPTQYGNKVENLQTIMYNMHDLINQYRPHQARESLILMMEERVENMRDEIRRIREGKEKVGKLMQGLSEDGQVHLKPEPGERSGGVNEEVEEAWKRRQRERWAAIEREVDMNG